MTSISSAIALAWAMSITGPSEAPASKTVTDPIRHSVQDIMTPDITSYIQVLDGGMCKDTRTGFTWYCGAQK